MNYWLKTFFESLFFLLIIACQPTDRQEGQQQAEEDDEITEIGEAAGLVIYQADLQNLNGAVKAGQAIDGTAKFTVDGNIVTIEVEAFSLPPNMMHLQHLHDFKDGSEAKCPPFEEADDNDDGVVDLIETRDYSGITMIPLHENPVSLEIKTETYPTANEEGDLTYTNSFTLDSMATAVEEKYGIENFDLENFVIFLHGISEMVDLPESVQSLPDVPASVTLPIACGQLQKIE